MYQLLVILTIFTPLVISQTPVNVALLYDHGDKVAMDGYEKAIQYLEKKKGDEVKINKQYKMGIKKQDDIEVTVNATCDLVDSAIASGEPPHVVLDLTKSGMVSEAAKSFTRAFAYPTFTASYGHAKDLREWRDLSPSMKNILVQVMPPGDIVPLVVRDVIENEVITNAAILYDDSFEMEHKFKSLLQNIACRHVMVMIEKDNAGLRKQLKTIKGNSLVNFYVLGSLKNIKRVLDIATDEKLFGIKYSWTTVSKETGDMSCACQNATILHIKPKMNSDVKQAVGMLKSSYGLTMEPTIDSVFYFNFVMRGILATRLMIKKDAYKDFSYTQCSDFDETKPTTRNDFNFKQALKDIKLGDDTMWGKIKWGDNGMTYPMYTMMMDRYSIENKRTKMKKSIGDWESGMPGKLLFKQGQNLNELKAVTVYKITTVEQPPFIMKVMGDNGETTFEGYCIDLIDEIKGIVDFEYEIYEAPDGKFGTMDENMQWNGMIKELIDKNADIALAPLSVMAERENVVDFTVPYYDLVGITILMTKPKVATSLFRFLTVLEPTVWVCILFAYAFTSVLMYIFDRFSPYSYQNNRDKYIDDDEKREFTFKECLWFCMTSLTPQGGGEAPKNLSGRLVAATWWLFGFIIIASYTANLAAFLTVSRLDTPIESLDDLSNQYKVQYSPMNGTSTMTYFERMAYIEKKFYEIWKDMSLNDSMSDVERAKLAVWDYPVSDKYTKMWQSMQEAGLPNDFQQALDRVRSSTSSSEGYAYLGDATDIRYQVLTNCDLQIVGEEFSRKPYAIAVQQGSPLKDQFNDAILKLLNQRKLETLKERWWNQNPAKKVCEKEDDQSDGISIENIGGVFIVIFVGIALACITLAFEYWWYKQRKGGRISDSAKVMNVRQLTDEKPGFGDQEKSNFNTEYTGHTEGIDVAPVGNPW